MFTIGDPGSGTDDTVTAMLDCNANGQWVYTAVRITNYNKVESIGSKIDRTWKIMPLLFLLVRYLSFRSATLNFYFDNGYLLSNQTHHTDTEPKVRLSGARPDIFRLS